MADTSKLTFEDKQKIVDFMIPYAQQGKIKIIQVERMLGIENDPYERAELGLPAKLWTREEVHERFEQAFSR